MKLSEILHVDKIIPYFAGNTKEDIINELINQFSDDSRIIDIEQVRTSVLEREKIMSTGVGKGFAIPHSKTNGVDDIIAGFGRLSEPIDFQSLDEQPVNLVFLLVARENMVGPHIRLLSRISRMMNKDEFRKELLEAETREQIFEVFRQEEKNYT